MAKTFSTCSWLLAALGVAVTLAYFPYVAAWLPLGFLPYALLLGAARSARRPSLRAAVLGLMLATVCTTFWVYWDAILRPSTLNLMPLDVLILESLVGGVAWAAVRRSERARDLAGAA
jgi:hypothetical protein